MRLPTKEKLDKAFYANIELFKTIQNTFKKKVHSKKVWDESWSRYIDSVSRSLTDMNQIIKIRDGKGYPQAFVSLRAVFENFLFFTLYTSGKEAFWFEEYIITPGINSNPIARDNTMAKWKKFKDENPKTDIVALNPLGENKILIKRRFSGMYEKNDINRKGKWMPPYYFLYHEYDPTKAFVSSLPTVIENDIFPEITIKHKEIHQHMYHRYFQFNAILQNLKLNKFISIEEEERIRVHYNFLSIFCHPNKDQVRHFKLKNDSVNFETIFEYVPDPVIEILISCYIVKLQERYLLNLVKRLEKLSGKRWAIKLIRKIKSNSSIANILWFVYDKPTEMDKQQNITNRLMKERRSKKISVSKAFYYANPLSRIRRFYGYI